MALALLAAGCTFDERDVQLAVPTFSNGGALPTEDGTGEAPNDPNDSSNTNELPPAIAGLETNDGALSGAAASCDSDAATCLSPSDAADPGCIPTGPRDCSSDLDNDCDGQADNIVDDVCACVAGSIQACQEHPGLDGRGPCRAGLQTCFFDEATLTSAWGPCEGSVGPGGQDSCTVPGDDVDCDGAPNSGCACVDGDTQDCGPNTTNGICRNGTSTCSNSAFGECEGAVFAAVRDSCEVRGDDSNCNGIPSEGCSCINGETLPCGPDTDAGNCQRGTRTCVDGAFGQCVGAIFAAQRDSCATRGDDANCNGVPNDGCECIASETRACGPNTDLGNCQRGTQTCVNGSFSQCVGAIFPAASDSCTTRDDDANCNGAPNDGCGCVDGEIRQCGPTTDAGICQRVTQTCVNGNFGQCVGAVFPAARNCGSQQDNDCDGRADNTIDNVCTCTIAQTRECLTHPQDGVGSCRAGQQQCVAGANNSSSAFGACTGSVGPAASDSCTQPNNDANCNGRANDACQCIGTETRPCGSDVGNCQRGTQTCANGAFGQCAGETRPAASDSCTVRGDDANCNGVANDNCGECLNGETQPCDSNTNTGECNIGTRTCANGRFGSCVGGVPRRARNCSSALDNDCDGRPDNTTDTVCTCAVGATEACNGHIGDGNGPCRAGTRTCRASADGTTSAFGTCSGEVAPRPNDTCTSPTGIDSDCDGAIECECLFGQGNAACRDTPAFSVCSSQGQCVPCARDADCSLVLGRRNTCVSGDCVLKPLESSCTIGAECASGNCVDPDPDSGQGVCCNESCNGDCETCRRPGLIGRCSPDEPRTACVPRFSEHFICDGERGNDHCLNPEVECGAQSCEINNETTCCYRGSQTSTSPACVSRAACVPSTALPVASVVNCDSVRDCQTGEVCCYVGATSSTIVCMAPANCVPSPVSTAFAICEAPGPLPVNSGVNTRRFTGFTCN